MDSSIDPALRVANGELTTVREAMRELNRRVGAPERRSTNRYGIRRMIAGASLDASSHA